MIARSLYKFLIIQQLLIIQVLLQTQTDKDNLSSETFNTSKLVLFGCNNPIKDCQNHGVCEADRKDCNCFNGYSTYFTNYTNHFDQVPRCNYKLKKQLYALVIASFLSFGMVHFYLENYLIGYLQLILFMLIFITNIFFTIRLSLKHIKSTSPNELRSSLIKVILVLFFSFIFLLWYTFDIIMVILNMYRDSYNMELALIL